MLFQCFIWIPHMWNGFLSVFRTCKVQDVGPLPIDILVEILSRLPADEVLKCKSVCKEWKALITTRRFSQVHLKRASPTVFLVERRSEFFIFDDGAKDSMCKKVCDNLGYFFLNGLKTDGMFKKVRKRSMHNPWLCPKYCYSYNGFLVFKSRFVFTIYNPMTKEEMTVLPRSRWSDLCGIYFHLPTREYRFIHIGCDGKLWCYEIFGQLSRKWRKLCTFGYRPLYRAKPVVVNGFIYWMGHPMYPCEVSIITFNIETEELRALPHPGNRCKELNNIVPIRHAIHMQLLQMEDKIVFCCGYEEKHINIWELEDSGKWIWVERYRVSIDWDLKKYPFPHLETGIRRSSIKILNIQHGEMLLFWYFRGFFRYNLRTKTLKHYDPEISGYKVSSLESDSLEITTYTKSFETLTTAKILPTY